MFGKGGVFETRNQGTNITDINPHRIFGNKLITSQDPVFRVYGILLKPETTLRKTRFLGFQGSWVPESSLGCVRLGGVIFV